LHLTNGEIQRFEELSEYEDIFAEAEEDYGTDTGNAGPIRQSPRRISVGKQAEVKEMLDKMQRHRVIEESENPWFSPVVLVREKNGEHRFCVDYRKLNDVTKRDSFHCF
jgi:hypothetical protein